VLILTDQKEIINEEEHPNLTGQQISAFVLTPKDITDIPKILEYLEAEILHRLANPSNSTGKKKREGF